MLMCASGQYGGTEVRMLQEAMLLIEMGWAPTVAVPAFPSSDRFLGALREKGVPFVELDPPRLMNDWRLRHVHFISAELSARRWMKRQRLQLAHVFLPWTNQGLDQLWLAGRCRVPTLVSVHNTFLPVTFSSWHTRHLRTAFRSVVAVYGVSARALTSFVDIFESFLPSSARRTVNYNSVDMERFRPSADMGGRVRAELGLPHDGPLIGCVARLDKQKRPLAVLEVFQRVREHRTDAHMLFVGEGELLHALRHEVTAAGLDDSVTIVGFHSRVEEIFAALDVHLLMSRNEGFGLVTAEALACGTPIVASRVAGTEEVVRDCPAAFAVEKDDTVAAADSILSILAKSPREREEMGRAARKHVAERFSHEAWLKRTRSLYHEAIGI